MDNLFEDLRHFQENTVGYAISFGQCHSQDDLENHKKFTFKEVTRIGSYSVGVCRWSARGTHDPSACTVYLAIPEKVMWHGYMVSPLIFKEYWRVASTEDQLWTEREVRRPIGPTKNHWWQIQRYTTTLVPTRISGIHTLEEAIELARHRAEVLHGITEDQQSRIAEVVKEMKLRDKAMKELEAELTTGAG